MGSGGRAEVRDLLLEAAQLLFHWNMLAGGNEATAKGTRTFLAKVGYDYMAARLTKVSDSSSDALAAELAEAKRGLRAAREALEQHVDDAARWRYVTSQAEWRRQAGDDRDPGYALLAVRLPYDADLSCPAMREIAIDRARGANQ